jgi:CRP/FNR family transcriptional regulator, nitrogen oxide reductase regulator
MKSDQPGRARRLPLLAVLREAAPRELAASSSRRAVARGERCWAEGTSPEDFTFVARGQVKLVRATESGRDAIVEVVGDGSLLCASVVCAHVPYCCTSVAMEDTEIVAVPRARLLELLERTPAAARGLVEEMGCRAMELCRRVEELSSGQVAQRIAKLLLKLTDRAGVARPGQGTWVAVPLSRQDLADLCGTTLETAIRVMSRLRRQGVVRSSGGGFLVQDRRRLEELVAGAGA